MIEISVCRCQEHVQVGGQHQQLNAAVQQYQEVSGPAEICPQICYCRLTLTIDSTQGGAVRRPEKCAEVLRYQAPGAAEHRYFDATSSIDTRPNIVFMMDGQLLLVESPIPSAP